MLQGFELQIQKTLFSGTIKNDWFFFKTKQKTLQADPYRVKNQKSKLIFSRVLSVSPALSIKNQKSILKTILIKPKQITY
jgi:hypothetical protein